MISRKKVLLLRCYDDEIFDSLKVTASPVAVVISYQNVATERRSMQALYSKTTMHSGVQFFSSKFHGMKGAAFLLGYLQRLLLSKEKLTKYLTKFMASCV